MRPVKVIGGEQLMRPENAGALETVKQQVEEFFAKLEPGKATLTGKGGLDEILRLSQRRL